MVWWRRGKQPEVDDKSVGLHEVLTAKPNQVRDKLRTSLGYDRIWTAGDFSDIGISNVADLNVAVDRRFASAEPMFQAALESVAVRQRLHRAGEGPDNLMMLLSEPAFYRSRTSTRFRYVLNHTRTCRFHVLVVCSWLRPLDREQRDPQ